MSLELQLADIAQRNAVRASLPMTFSAIKLIHFGAVGCKQLIAATSRQ